MARSKGRSWGVETDANGRMLVAQASESQQWRNPMTAAKAPANTPPSPGIASVPRVSKEELERRLSVTLRHMDEKGIDVAIVTTPDNIYYLSGYFTRAITSNTALIIN